MKKWIAFSIATIMILISISSALAFSGSGSGTIIDPYNITNSTQFLEIRDNLSAHYILGNDVDLAGINITGNESNFTGSLNGQGFAINNYTMPLEQGIPAIATTFFSTNNANISNIAFNNFRIIDSQESFKSPFLGFVYKSANTIFENITFNANIFYNQSNFATYTGFVVQDFGGNEYNNFIVDFTVYSKNNWDGGIMGSVFAYKEGKPTSIINNATATVDITTDAYSSNNAQIGGLVGQTNNLTINQSFVNGSIQSNYAGTTTNRWFSGLIGVTASTNTTVTIDNSYSAVVINSTGTQSGLVGVQTDGVIDYTTFNVIISNSYSASQFLQSTVNYTIGNLNTTYGTTSNVYYDYEEAGTNVAGCDGVTCTGLSSYQAVQEASYTGFDFTNIWKIDEGVSYPVHRWNEYIYPTEIIVPIQITNATITPTVVFTNTTAQLYCGVNTTINGYAMGEWFIDNVSFDSNNEFVTNDYLNGSFNIDVSSDFPASDFSMIYNDQTNHYEIYSGSSAWYLNKSDSNFSSSDWVQNNSLATGLPSITKLQDDFFNFNGETYLASTRGTVDLAFYKFNGTGWDATEEFETAYYNLTMGLTRYSRVDTFYNVAQDRLDIYLERCLTNDTGCFDGAGGVNYGFNGTEWFEIPNPNRWSGSVSGSQGYHITTMYYLGDLYAYAQQDNIGSRSSELYNADSDTWSYTAIVYPNNPYLFNFNLAPINNNVGGAEVVQIYDDIYYNIGSIYKLNNTNRLDSNGEILTSTLSKSAYINEQELIGQCTFYSTDDHITLVATDSLNSTPLIVSNTPPEKSIVSSSYDFNVSNDIEFTCSIEDIDGSSETLNYQYEIYVNEVLDESGQLTTTEYDWEINSSYYLGLPTSGYMSFYTIDNEWYAFKDSDGSGYKWNGTYWNSDSSTTAGLTTGYQEAGQPFTRSDDPDTPRLIRGHVNGRSYLWYYNGSQWANEVSFADMGSGGRATGLNIDGVDVIFQGDGSNPFERANVWNGSQWLTDNSYLNGLASGLGGLSELSYVYRGISYIIGGTKVYRWDSSGSIWIEDSITDFGSTFIGLGTSYPSYALVMNNTPIHMRIDDLGSGLVAWAYEDNPTIVSPLSTEELTTIYSANYGDEVIFSCYGNDTDDLGEATNVSVTVPLFAGGTGTALDPYQISIPQHFQNINKSLGSYYEIINDIDFSGFTLEQMGTFTGDINGNGYDLSNIYLPDDGITKASIFLEINSPREIKNINLVNVTYDGSMQYVAPFSYSITFPSIVKFSNINVDLNLRTTNANGFVNGIIHSVQYEHQFENISITGYVYTNIFSGIGFQTYAGDYENIVIKDLTGFVDLEFRGIGTFDDVGYSPQTVTNYYVKNISLTGSPNRVAFYGDNGGEFTISNVYLDYEYDDFVSQNPDMTCYNVYVNNEYTQPISTECDFGEDAQLISYKEMLGEQMNFTYDAQTWVSSLYDTPHLAFETDYVEPSNTAPDQAVVDFSPDPFEDNNLDINFTCYADDTHNLTLNYYYNLTKNGVLNQTGSWLGVSANSTQTLTLSAPQEPFINWSFTCFASDGLLNGTSASVNMTTYPNTAPEINSSIINETFREYEDVIGYCLATDQDNDNLTYNYEWFVNNVSVDSGTSASTTQNVSRIITLDADNYVGGDEVILQCEGYDGQALTEKLNSTATTILPYITVTFSSIIENIETQEITISWTSSASKMGLYRDGTFVTNTTGIVYTFVGLQPDTEYNFTFRPYDASGIRAVDRYVVETTEFTDNNPPIMQSILFSPTVIKTETTVTGYCKATDVDTESIYYDYEWFVNDVSVKSGTTAITTQGTTKNIGTLSGSDYFDYQDNVTLRCRAFDNIYYSSYLNSTLQVQNTLPTITEYLINDTGSVYIAEYNYADADNHSETVIGYEWYKNGVALGFNLSNISIGNFTAGDNVISQVTTSDGIDQVSENSSLFFVGDLEAPVIGELTVPINTYTDQATYISAECTDDVGVANGYPKVSWLNPNLVYQEFPLFYEQGDTYSRNLVFSVAGEYTNIQFECKDGNSNTIKEFNGTVIALVRETVINTGGTGGGGGTTTTEPFRELESFEIRPSDEIIQMSEGGFRILEFEVENTDIVDIDFTASIQRTNDQQVYDWMEFDNGAKTFRFTIDKSTGLESNTRFIRYIIEVPEGTPIGDYLGEIEISGLESVGSYKVLIQVREGVGVNLLSFLNNEIFTVPSLSTPTGAVTGEELPSDGTPIKVWHVLVTLTGIMFIAWLIQRYS